MREGRTRQEPLRRREGTRATQTAPHPVAEADKLASTLVRMRPTRAVTTAQLALACGMRVGEVAALTMRDCDPSRNIIDVRGSIGRSNGVTERGRSYLKAPKTDAARSP